jgi:hypothetical protein
LFSVSEIEEVLLAEHLPSVILDSLKVIPKEVFDMSFSEIKKRAAPDIDLERLRVAFWTEYERSQRTKTSFMCSNVHKGIMTNSGFRKSVLGNSFKLLYMTASPPEYKIIMEEMLNYGLALEREILDMNHFSPNKDGDQVLDIDLLKLKHKIIDGVHARVKGLPANTNINLNREVSTESKMPNLTDVQRRIDALTSGEVSIVQEDE